MVNRFALSPATDEWPTGGIHYGCGSSRFGYVALS